MRSWCCCLFGRVPSQSLGVALSAVLLGRITGLRGAASIAHAKCATASSCLSIGFRVDVLLNVFNGLLKSLFYLLDVVLQIRAV